MNFRIIFTAPNSALYGAFISHFGKFGHAVSVNQNYFQNIQNYDCLVSPANSFGKMDGGMDGDICEYFGYDIEKKVQQEIRLRYGSFQPVGTSLIIETDNPEHPFLAHTPTMFLPEDVRDTLNPYMAFKGLLLAINQYNRKSKKPIQTVVCPGFGTGVGMMEPEVAIKQMALAYELVLFAEHARSQMEVYKKEQQLLKNI